MAHMQFKLSELGYPIQASKYGDCRGYSKWLNLVHNKNITLAENLNITFSGVNN